MTKKVLIDFDDIEYISKCLLNRYGSDVSDWLERWFDDQPDVGLMDVNQLIGHKERMFNEN